MEFAAAVRLRRVRRLRRTRLWVATSLGLILLAAPAAATTATLTRGLTNIIGGPLDIALAPVSSAVGIYTNLQEIDDSPWVRRVYPIPAFFYAQGLQVGCGVIRAVTGVLELIPGIPLAFMDADVDPLFDPVDDAVALVEIDTPIMDEPFRFGINYTTPAY